MLCKVDINTCIHNYVASSYIPIFLKFYKETLGTPYRANVVLGLSIEVEQRWKQVIISLKKQEA